MFSTSLASFSMGSCVNQPMMVSIVALRPAIADTSVYRTTCPANSVMKSTKSLILLDKPGSFSFNAIKGGSSR